MQTVKDDFYKTFSKIDSYKDLVIKKNTVTDELEYILNNNKWNLKEHLLKLKKIKKVENNDYYNGILNGVYLLDYNRKPKFKTISIEDFNNYKFNENIDNPRNEQNYINHFKTWLNVIFPDESNLKNFNYFVLNQNKILLRLMEVRNDRNNSIETLRKDINLMLRILTISEAPKDIITKYKILNKNLSLLTDIKEGDNKLDELEQTKFIKYPELLKIREGLYNEWEREYENLTVAKQKSIKIRTMNIKALLLSFYVLFPPLRTETLNLKIVKSHKQAKEQDYAIYIKDINNIWIYLNKIKKTHKPIKYNLWDEIINSFQIKESNILIKTIIESVTLYPREFLFINEQGKQYTEKGLQKILSEMVPGKNLGVNSLRSIYASYWIPKLNKNQINRIAFLMRTSFNMLSTNYLKIDDTKELERNIVNVVQPAIINNIVISKTKNVRDRSAYLKNYYEQNKEKIISQIKNNNKDYYKRILRELNNGLMEFKTVRDSTIDKYKIEFDKETNKYISKL